MYSLYLGNTQGKGSSTLHPRFLQMRVLSAVLMVAALCTSLCLAQKISGARKLCRISDDPQKVSTTDCSWMVARQLHAAIQSGEANSTFSSASITQHYLDWIAKNDWSIVKKLNEYRAQINFGELVPCGVCTRCLSYKGPGLAVSLRKDGIFNEMFMACDRRSFVLVPEKNPVVFL